MHGSNFPFSYWFCMGVTTAALLCCLWCIEQIITTVLKSNKHLTNYYGKHTSSLSFCIFARWITASCNFWNFVFWRARKTFSLFIRSAKFLSASWALLLKPSISSLCFFLLVAHLLNSVLELYVRLRSLLIRLLNVDRAYTYIMMIWW